MADDTAQALAPAETDPIADAMAAFRAAEQPEAPPQERDDKGRFAAREPEDEGESADEEAGEEEIAEPEAGEPVEGEAEDEGEPGEAETAHPLPPSWPEEQAEHWAQLPAETREFISAREAERERTINAKFQESANARKEYELSKREADAKRNELLEALGTVVALYEAPEPDPRSFGHGTQQYDAAGYNAAVAQWHQNARALAQLKEQREAYAKEQAEADDKSFKEWKDAHEAEYWPKFVSAAPELKEPEKAAPLLRGLVEYAVANGIPAENFDEDNRDAITSAQLLILHKAKRFDDLMAKQAKPKPKAGPAVKPGVSSSRTVTKQTKLQKAFDRVAKEGSVQSGAALFRQLRQG